MAATLESKVKYKLQWKTILMKIVLGKKYYCNMRFKLAHFNFLEVWDINHGGIEFKIGCMETF
jgi:hypothetical protein